MKVVWVVVAALLLGCGGRRGSGTGKVGTAADAAVQGGAPGIGGAGGGGGMGFGAPDAVAPVETAVLPQDAARDTAPPPDAAADQRPDGVGAAGDAPGDAALPADAVAPVEAAAPDVAPGPDAAAPMTPRFHLTLPLSSSVVTTRMPTVGWTDPGGFFYFIVELCRDQACNDVLERSFSSLTTFTAENALPEGVVYWRVKAMLATAVGETTPTSELFVGPQTAHDTSVLAVPDFNRDGVPDLALAAEGGDVVVRFLGAGPSGPVELHSQLLPGPTRALAYGVDLNSDGFGDLVQSRPGAVEVWYGGNVLVRVTTLTGGAGFGSSLAGVGDVNGDGFGDVVIGSRPASGAATASLYLSGRAGLSGPTGAPLAADRFGAAADADADGYADVIACSPAAGKAWFHPGSASGLGPGRLLADPRAGGAGTFGHACQGVGDINGDGFGDAVVTGGGTQLQAYLYLGGDQGFTSASATISLGSATGAADDLQVASAGDVNRDGYGDLLITGAGAVRLYVGVAGGLAPGPVTSLPGDYRLAAGLGDLNGDRTADVLVAPRTCDQPVKILGGSGAGLSAAPIYTAPGAGTAPCPNPLLAH